MFHSFFAYSPLPHTRRHGPSGYGAYQSFKPWLRDEFTFRCVFCLLRERWCGLEADCFGVEQLSPRSRTPELEWSYENLVYACAKCNSTKSTQASLLDPCAVGYGVHLFVNADGTVAGLTKRGTRLIRALRLNRSQLLRVRRFFLDLAVKADENPTGEAADILHWLLRFPEDLPDLASLRPPGGNTRPDGVPTSYFAQRQRDELPATY